MLGKIADKSYPQRFSVYNISALFIFRDEEGAYC
jgi:hypothetical protein